MYSGTRSIFEKIATNKYFIKAFGILMYVLSPFVIPICMLLLYYKDIWNAFKEACIAYFNCANEFIKWD